jgi:endoglucanase Acf2
VTVSVKNKEKKNLFEVTALQGSPFVFIASKVSHLSFALPQGSTVTELSCSNPCASALQVTAKNRTYLVLSDQKKGLAMNGAQMEATFASTGGKLTVAVVAPQTKVEDYLPYAFTTMNGTKASFAVGTESITTTFQFPAETLIGILPHQFASLTKEPSKLLGTYDTVRGPIRLYKGKSFQTTVQKPAILPGIPPVKADKDALATLKKDIQDAKPGDGDVYWQGKNLLKIANLAQVADSMGDTTSRATAVKKAKDILADWCTASKGETSKYFGYDTRAGGIVALPQGFGSEHFNDHHFHYGYFIHAAAIVNQLDPKFDSEYGDCIRLLIKDIANVDRSDKSFPYLRHFDAYAGHSWAGGLTTFADGNNQESTSEALQAWYAMALYGRVTGNKTLEEQGLWLWSQESLGAKTYWLNSTKNSGVFPKDFAYPMASIVWGGKYDYATFFDGSDGAVRGIQFFPFTPALFTVLDKATVTRLMTPLVSKEANGIWKTGAMFYDALFNPKSAKVLLSPLDSVYSDSYLQQWLTISKSIGVPVTPLPSCNGWIFSGSKGSSVVVFRKKSDASLCEFSANGKKVVKKDIKERWNVLGI